MSITITAKPIEWEMAEYKNNPGYREWTDDHFGFFITEDPGDTELGRFHASWGEGETDYFETLEEAQAWCQEQIGSFISEHAVVKQDSCSEA